MTVLGNKEWIASADVLSDRTSINGILAIKLLRVIPHLISCCSNHTGLYEGIAFPHTWKSKSNLLIPPSQSFQIHRLWRLVLFDLLRPPPTKKLWHWFCSCKYCAPRKEFERSVHHPLPENRLLRRSKNKMPISSKVRQNVLEICE
jgi:hypothetical protein